MEEIKLKIIEYKKWSDDLNKYIMDKARGNLNVDGKKIKAKLQPHVSSNMEKIKEDLLMLMRKKS